MNIRLFARRVSICVSLLLGASSLYSISSSASTMVTHEQDIYSTARGNCQTPVVYAGYAPPRRGTCVYPRVLRIVPGENWCNYVGAARAGLDYKLRSVGLSLTTPSGWAATDVPPMANAAIALEWPLLFAPPAGRQFEGATYSLSVVYVTSSPWDDDGPGANPPGYVHVDLWTWKMKTGPGRPEMLLDLFRDLPLGASQTPMISSDPVYWKLRNLAEPASVAYTLNDQWTLLNLIYQMIDIVDATTFSSWPAPAGAESLPAGIADTPQNPVGARLVWDFTALDRSWGCPVAAPSLHLTMPGTR